MDLVIYAHPDNKKGHNAEILRYVLLCLKKNNCPFDIIDLYADGFDPLLRLTKESKKKTALVKRYQKLLAKADRLIFIFPAWWYNVPAILKGFIEHTFNSGLAYSYAIAPDNTMIVERKLTGKTAVVINTYGRSEQECVKYGSPIGLIFDKVVLEFCGVNVTSRLEWFDVKPPAFLNHDFAVKIEKALES